jgi:hypothetical protein
MRGGAYDNSSSTSFESSPITAIVDLDPDEGAIAQADWLAGRDTVTINSTFQLTKFPFGIPRNDDMSFSMVGLGPDSVLLSRLRDAAAIASRSWSLYWGQTGTAPEHQMDGSLVIGGIDKAKTTSENYTGSLGGSSGCQMTVPLTDMLLVFPNGTETSLFDKNGYIIGACIDLAYPLITLWGEVWDRWTAFDPASASNMARQGSYPNLWGLNYPASQV